MAEKKLTEEELKKSIEALAPVKEEAKKEEEKTVVETAPLAKKAAETVKEHGSAPLQKSLEVSNVLAEFAGVIGLHVDSCTEAMYKSLDQAAQRDLAFLKVMTKFGEKLDEMGKQIAEYGKQPVAAQTKVVVSKDADVLKKSTDDTKEAKATNPADARKLILKSMEKMALKHEPNSKEFGRLQRATAKFESTGQIDEETLAEVVKETGVKIAA